MTSEQDKERELGAEQEVQQEETVDADEVQEKELDEEASVEKPEEEDFKSKYFYLAAEMENVRKRFDRERENFLKYGNEKILSALIEVVDNFDRTIDALVGDEDEKITNIRTGIEMVRTQFLDVLKNNGLERVEALGKEFDPNLHEAMGQQSSEGKKDQEIIQEYQKGYVLNGRLLRAAKVIIIKND